jgi:hypothetical protein
MQHQALLQSRIFQLTRILAKLLFIESSLPKGALLVYKEVLLAGETADSNANHATGLLSWIFNFALVGCFWL